MDTKRTEKHNTARLLVGLFGEPTSAKTAGLAYSLAVPCPVILAFVFMLILTVAGVMNEHTEGQDWYLYCNYLLPQISFALVACLMLGYTGKPLKERAKAQICAPKYYAIALLMQIGLFALSALNVLFLEFLQKHGYNGAEVRIPSLDGFGFVGVILVVAVLPAIFEEILFRGIILHGLKSAFSETASIVLCGALFALYHQNPAQTIYQFCCGTAFAFVAIRAGSVLPTMLAHLFNNALIITLEKFPVAWFGTLAFTVVSAVCLVGATVWLCFCKKREMQPPVAKDKKTFFLFAGVGMAICLVSWFAVLLG